MSRGPFFYDFLPSKPLHEGLVTNINCSSALQIALVLRRFHYNRLRHFVLLLPCRVENFGANLHDGGGSRILVSSLKICQTIRGRFVGAKYQLHLCKLISPVLLRLVWTAATLGKIQAFSSSNFLIHKTRKDTCTGWKIPQRLE